MNDRFEVVEHFGDYRIVRDTLHEGFRVEGVHTEPPLVYARRNTEAEARDVVHALLEGDRMRGRPRVPRDDSEGGQR